MVCLIKLLLDSGFYCMLLYWLPRQSALINVSLDLVLNVSD